MANLSREAKEDRRQKEEAEILKRSDEEYLEIEAFKDYEFSQCIAFEMAKRDPELKQTVERLVKFYKRHRGRINFKPEDRDFFNEAFGYRLHRRAQEVFTHWYDYIAQEFWFKPIDLYEVDYDELAIEMAEVYTHIAYDIQDQAPNEKFAIESSEGVYFESSVDLKNEYFFEGKDDLSDEELLEAFESFDMDPGLIESKIRVTDNFSRPKLSIPAAFNRSVEVELNLALPQKELIAYIEYIKERYEKDKSSIKSAAELLGAELSDAGFMESDSDQMYKRDRRKTMTEKCADLLFIYDCNVSNLSMDYTLDHLDLYWNEERNAFPEQFQQKTYKRYLKLAKDFIENRKYQSLLIDQ